MTHIDIRELRKQSGRTLQEIADLLGVTRRTVMRWERNPDSISHGTYLELTDFLERSVQIRKEVRTMGKDYGMVKVVAKLDYDDEDDLAGITVPIPDWLTNDFEPSKPVTAEQTKRFLTRGIEPYEGYAAEFQKWEDGWNDVRRRQAEADGEPYYMSEPVEVDPEFDEEGRPIAYDEVNIVQDPDSGAASMDLPEDQYTDEDWEQEEKEEQENA